MTLQGCCCCGLRGGAKAVGVLFLVITLLQLVGVIVAWAVLVAYPINVQGFGVDTPEGQFGVKVRETQSMLGGRGGDLTVNLGKFGKFGVSSDGSVSAHTPVGDISSGGRQHSSLPGLEGMPANVQVPLICCTVFVLLAVLFNSMLIHGTNNDSSCAVLAWLVFYGAVFVVMSIGPVGGLIFMAVVLSSPNSWTGAPIGIGSGVGLLACAQLWFWWAVVLTFYRELRDGTRGYKYHRDVSLQEPPTPCPANEQRKAEACA